jgi:hypothetical protein|tara:strand:+ start:579 stop:752 length:174 start_codon:yes stop_codon:yes gene_type:complete
MKTLGSLAYKITLCIGQTAKINLRPWRTFTREISTCGSTRELFNLVDKKLFALYNEA